MLAKLIIVSESEQTSQEVILDKPRITIGRKVGNDLQFNRPEISGTHAAFLSLDDQYFITDLGSTNGTLLNGVQLAPQEKYPLQDQDIVTVNPYSITFVIERDVSETIIEAPSREEPTRKPSGTVLEKGAKIRTGTQEDMVRVRPEEIERQVQAQTAGAADSAPLMESQPAASPSVRAQEVAPAAEAPSFQEQVTAQKEGTDASAAASDAGFMASLKTVIGDYIWLALGGILVLAAIGLVLYMLLAV